MVILSNDLFVIVDASFTLKLHPIVYPVRQQLVFFIWPYGSASCPPSHIVNPKALALAYVASAAEHQVHRASAFEANRGPVCYQPLTKAGSSWLRSLLKHTSPLSCECSPGTDRQPPQTSTFLTRCTSRCWLGVQNEAGRSHMKSPERCFYISYFCSKQFKVKRHISKDSKCKIPFSFFSQDKEIR